MSANFTTRLDEAPYSGGEMGLTAGPPAWRDPKMSPCSGDDLLAPGSRSVLAPQPWDAAWLAAASSDRCEV